MARVAQLARPQLLPAHSSKVRHLAGEGAGDDGSSSVVAAPSTPKKLLGSLLEAGGLTKSEVTRLEEEMMTIRMSEVGAQAELKDQKLKVMELETEVSEGKWAFVFMSQL